MNYLDFFGADKQPSNKETHFCFYVVGHAQTKITRLNLWLWGYN